MRYAVASCAAVAALVVASESMAGLVVTPLAGGDAAFNALTINGTLERAVAEGRIGNALTTGTWETALWQQGGVGTPKAQGQFNVTNGTTQTFSLTWNGVDTVTYSVGATTISWNQVAGDFTDIFIRTRSATDSTVLLSSLGIDLNSDSSFEWTGGSLASSGNGNVNYLHISNMGAAFPAFTLSGAQNFSWTGAQPTNSALAYQIKLSNVVPAPGAAAMLLAGGLLAIRRRR